MKFRKRVDFAIVDTVGNGTKAFKPLFKEYKFRRGHKVVEIYWEAKLCLIGISFADGGRDHQKNT